MSRTSSPPAPASPAQPSARWVGVCNRIRGKRPLLTALFVLAALILALASGEPPANLLAPRWTLGFVVPWLLLLAGVGVRIWGAGNLRKNQEITDTGIYRMVRHPLYTGSLLVFLVYFLTVGNPWVGLALFVAMVGLVYYPTMISEEQGLAHRYPEHFDRYIRRPRLVPNLRRLPEARATDRFSIRAARSNLGVRSLWVLVLLPLFLAALARIEQMI